MWIFSDEEIVKVMNRMNDVWNIDDIENERLRASDRLVGVLDALISPSHYYPNGTMDKIKKK